MKIAPFEAWIIFEDENLLVINKPPMVSSLDERIGEELNVLRLARTYEPQVQLCHRIDKETSGVLVMAKNADAYRTVSMAFQNREVEKIYHAVVDGQVDFTEQAVDLPIHVTKSGKVRIDPDGKEAVTLFNSLEVFQHFTLMECMPITGRQHQIRIHLATQNAPITGDLLYGGKWPYLSQIKRKFKASKNEEERPMINRFALHAYSLFFKSENLSLDIQAPYPKDMEVLVKLIQKNDR